MLSPAIPENESQRLKALQDANILYSPSQEEFDNITQLASFICKTPVSLISLVGEHEQWFKSKYGTELCSSKRDISFCSHAILNPEDLMEVQDTRLDKRFVDNPFVLAKNEPILYYAGMPLKDFNRMPLGTLCVIDTKPNKLDENQKKALKSLAKQVEILLELKRKNDYLESVKKELNDHNAMLKNFAGVVSHDMKMPLANMIITADILKAKFGEKLGVEGLSYLKNLKQAGLRLSGYINGILDHYESDSIAASNCEEFDVHQLLEEIIDLLNITEDCIINLPENNTIISSNRAALEQIFLNLLGNSLKYNDKPKIIIDIEFSQTPDFYYFSVKDNGIGIPKEKEEDIFKLFTIVAKSDRSGNKGNGIGLSTVKRLVGNLGGNLNIESEIGKGTRFNFSIRRKLS
ncbi:GAF domain-containing sensor histidine kinase [Salegentibacter maritimus]|uniref:GAF domain-containing sensor histidine kinase n=1 Tax=Salegentibacter maritimus TaxID=2794347 RepID=UPI0018E440FF|nr:GAF domain-containing sensor histidine kinase [Salegentibacter maritimus]MBI6115258.1 GAF domain-containing sensor histidine kinase [Salegentibacter maritimus]